MTQPSRLTFWRIALAITTTLAFATAFQTATIAQGQGIHIQSSKSWMAGLGLLACFGLLALAAFALTFTARRDDLLARLSLGERLQGGIRRLVGCPLFILALAAFPIFYFDPYFITLFHRPEWTDLFVFWMLTLLGTQALKMLWPSLSWPAALLVTLLFQATLQRAAGYFPDVSMYPFAMGWSETSRFYYPSLFVAPLVYGRAFAWPILHPTLHLLLAPPYLFNAPLWFHRVWQVGMRFLLVGLVSPALLYRLKLQSRVLRWLLGVWIFLFLFVDGLYLHLAVPLCLVLWGFSAQDDRRTWLFVILASLWSGVSRINWYPVPAMLATALYLLEVPYRGQKFWRYLLKPAAWFVIGTGLAFAAMRAYIAASGVTNPLYFYTSLSSNLLWYRLWPNASYALGVLPAILLFSLPVVLVIGLALARGRGAFHPLRLALLGLALLVLFAGGLVVSMKIGGGADIHNLDAYACLLLVVGAYLLFGRYTREDGQAARPLPVPWELAVLLVLVPAWFTLHVGGAFVQYDPAEAQATLTALQQRVDQVDAQGGEILFITQRQLISMHMLQNVTLVPEYEREELMEMAMGDNQTYLGAFDQDIQAHRFAAIIVDPLKFNYLDATNAMSDENNAWVRRVVKPILCSYRADQSFPADHIVIYVPQEGAQQCLKQ